MPAGAKSQKNSDEHSLAKGSRDEQKYGGYIRKVPQTIERFGGKYLVCGGQVKVVSGDFVAAGGVGKDKCGVD